jgi:hypothetical protein
LVSPPSAERSKTLRRRSPSLIDDRSLSSIGRQ